MWASRSSEHQVHRMTLIKSLDSVCGKVLPRVMADGGKEEKNIGTLATLIIGLMMMMLKWVSMSNFPCLNSSPS